MPKRSRKKKVPDFNQLARSIVDRATGTPTPSPAAPTRKRPKKKPADKRDPAAVALGRKGGLKGGKARAAKLSKVQLRESARRAAAARWGKKPE